MGTDRDPRHRSGEHRALPDDTPDELEQLSTIGALGSEIRSLRREMKIELKHFGERLGAAMDEIKAVGSDNQVVSQYSAAHRTSIKGLENRVTKLENASDQPSASAGWLKTAAKNPSIPWAVAGLLALAMILAAITGRSIGTLIPSKPASVQGQ